MENKLKKKLLYVLDIVINLAIILGLVIIIQTWIIAPYKVSGRSMCDTFNHIDGVCLDGEGERIIINEAGYLFGNPKRGEVVVFKVAEPTNNRDYYIKRVIGVPGDTIEIENGKVFLSNDKNDKVQLNEFYLNNENKNNTKTYKNAPKKFEVPEGKYFVLGDNRANSTDSRSCFGKSQAEIDCKENAENAFINKDQIRGKAWIVLWPPSKMRIVNNPTYPELAN